jgi:hypothetical protein
MRITRLTAIVACIIAFVQVAFAADPTIRLRFEIDTLRGYICLQARVNENREPEWLVFDTGGSGSLLLLPKAASRLNISYDKEAWQAFSEYSTVRGGYRVPEVVLRFDGDITYRVQNDTYVLAEDEELPLIVAVGNKLVKAAGVIGIGLFPKRYVKISYDTRELIVSTTPMELDGWQEVTAQYKENGPYIQLTVGNQPMTALLDSGAEDGLWLTCDQLKKLAPEAKPCTPSSDYFPTRLFPPTKLGEFPLNLRLIRISKKERPYLLFGALEMIHYNWIINTDGMRVYAKRREPLPKIQIRSRTSVLFHIFPLYYEERGFLAIPVPRGALWQSGIRVGENPEDLCLITEVNGVVVPTELKEATQEEMYASLLRLMASPFVETVRLRLQCKGQEQEFTFQPFADYKLYESVESIPFGGNIDWEIEYDPERGEQLRLTLTFSDPRWSAFYRVNGQPVEQHNQEHPHTVVRVVGLPEQFSVLDFIEYLHTQLFQGRSVTVICLNESGQEVEVEIPPREQVKSQAVSADGTANER